MPMKERKIPMRMCVGCREMKPKKELIRVVRSPEDVISMDDTGRKPGRGAYICKNAECLQKAIKQKQLERTFSCALTEEIRESLAKELQNLEANNAATP